jgi:hypothetical protein
MSQAYDRTTELIKVLSLLNRLDGRSKCDPKHPERTFFGGEDSQLEIRQELVQLALSPDNTAVNDSRSKISQNV